jgi:hypothetical protein
MCKIEKIITIIYIAGGLAVLSLVLKTLLI